MNKANLCPTTTRQPIELKRRPKHSEEAESHFD